MKKILTILLFLTPLVASAANEVVPHLVKSIAASQHGFIELLGPGKVLVKEKVTHYRKGKYIRARNIQSLSAIEGGIAGCVLHYASYDFSENIRVRQSCTQVMGVLGAVEAPAQNEMTQLPIKMPSVLKELGSKSSPWKMPEIEQ